MENKASQKRERDRKTPCGNNHTDGIVPGIASGWKYADSVYRIIGKGEHIQHIERQHLNKIYFCLRFQNVEEINLRTDQQEQTCINQPIDKRYFKEAPAIGFRLGKFVPPQHFPEDNASAGCKSHGDTLNQLGRDTGHGSGCCGICAHMTQDYLVHGHGKTPGQRRSQHARNDFPDIFLKVHGKEAQACPVRMNMVFLQRLYYADTQRDNLDHDSGIGGTIRSQAFPRADPVDQEKVCRHIDNYRDSGNPQAGLDASGVPHDHQVGLSEPHE